MTPERLRREAEDLGAEALGLIKEILIKHDKALLEECAAMLKERRGHVLVGPMVARKPLTEEEIMSIAEHVANEKLVGPVPEYRVRFARAIERAHGIGENNE